MGSPRILQIIKSAAISESGGQRNELQWRDLNTFAKTGHARDSSMRGRLHREGSGMLFRQVIAGKLAQAEEARVTGNGRKAHAAPELFKENVVGVGHGFRQIHVLAAANLKHSVPSDDVFFERGDRDCWLDSVAGNVAVTECDFLVDDGQDAAGVGIDPPATAPKPAQPPTPPRPHDRVAQLSTVP